MVAEGMKYLTLVLNTNFEPYDIWGWQKTMTKLLSSHSVSPLYDSNGDIIKYDKLIRDGQGNIYDLPQIIVLKDYVHDMNKKASYSKMNIYARDFLICQYCNEKTTPNNRTIDHIIPRQYFSPKRYSFGLSSFFNVVCCCKTCNHKKRNRTPNQAGMTLIRKPTHPTRASIYKNKLALLENVPESWKLYIYTHTEKV
jgi:5-methylcytosine-specific restriction endonuclease McrA